MGGLGSAGWSRASEVFWGFAIPVEVMGGIARAWRLLSVSCGCSGQLRGRKQATGCVVVLGWCGV